MNLPLNPSRLLSAEQVCDLLGATKPQLARIRRTDPTFPRAVRFGARLNSAIRFPEREISEWIAARVAAREGEAQQARERATALVAQFDAKGSRRPRGSNRDAQPSER